MRDFYFSVDKPHACARLNVLPMNTTNDTSLTRAADPASVFMGSTLDTSTGSVVFDGLEKGASLTANPNYPGGEPEIHAAEAQDELPVASMDLFEMMGLMYVAEGKISETRFRKAMDAVKGVNR